MNNNGISSDSPTVLPAAERREGERSEADRSSAAGKTVATVSAPPPRPNPEVVADAKRRSFTAEYKLRTLAEADAAAAPGAIGALLRREGLYSSHLVCWRRERQAGILKALTPRKRGPKSKRHPLVEENQKLCGENQRLTEELRKAEIVIDVQKNGRAVGHPDGDGGGEALMDAVLILAPVVGVKAACDSLSVARASFYRQRPLFGPAPAPLVQELESVAAARLPARALSPAERQAVLDCLHQERFQDRSPASVQATLLDEGTYLCSTRTMCRLIEQQGESRERRDQLTHPPYQKPELLATAPNQLWSWDITKLLGPVKWTYFYLYVILDIFSRYVAGWMVAHREGAELAEKFIEQTIHKHGIPPGQLGLHADRGRVMRSKPVAFLLADLGVTRTHSRPYVSDDNPYSESQFRTLKYRPEFPDRFGCIEDARAFCQRFFSWYNDEHRHSGIGLLTPAMVHFGEAATVLAHRQVVLTAAYQAHPDRFVRHPPKPLPLPSAVWINRPVPPDQKTKEGSQ